MLGLFYYIYFMDIKSLHQLFLDCNSVCTDTRKIEKNDIFFALKGDNFNGNEFSKLALEKGAKFVVIDEENYNINSQTILVDNVLKTLQNIMVFPTNYLPQSLSLKVALERHRQISAEQHH